MYTSFRLLIIIQILLGSSLLFSQDQQVVFRINPDNAVSCDEGEAQFVTVVDTLYFEDIFEIIWQYNSGSGWSSINGATPFDFNINNTYEEELMGTQSVLALHNLEEDFNGYSFRCTVNEIYTGVEATLTVHPLPEISFESSEYCFGKLTMFNNTSPDMANIYTWNWDFGDGQVSQLQNPEHYYASTGDYSVSLTATDNNGCVSNVSNDLTILELPQPQITASKYVFCRNESNILYRCTQDFASYEWEINTNSDPITGSEPDISFNCDENIFNPGQYNIELSVSDTSGCYNSVTSNFLVLTSKVPQEGIVHRKEIDSDMLVLLIDDEDMYSYLWFAYNINNLNDTIESSVNDYPYHLYNTEIDTANYRYGVEVRSLNSECSTVFLFE